MNLKFPEKAVKFFPDWKEKLNFENQRIKMLESNTAAGLTRKTSQEKNESKARGFSSFATKKTTTNGQETRKLIEKLTKDKAFDFFKELEGKFH